MIKALTDKQIRFLSELSNYFEREKRPPTTQELQEIMQLKSPRSVGQYLESLEQLGFIARGKGARNIQLLRKLSEINENRNTVKVPIVGVAACGAPLLAEQNIEDYMEISDQIARRPYQYFILRAKGYSMDKSGINNGDLVLVRRQPTAENREIVVALINEEASIKRIRFADDHIVLEPESTKPEYKPIVLDKYFQIQGIVVKTL
jgi:repressor LexA